mgnify:CR=1 FL=1
MIMITRKYSLLRQFLLAATLTPLHNLRFYVRLLRSAREAIVGARFDAFRAEFSSRYRAGEAEEEG